MSHLSFDTRHPVYLSFCLLHISQLRTIQFRKPPLVAEGTKQALNHELEAVLVHREADLLQLGRKRKVFLAIHIASTSKQDQETIAKKCQEEVALFRPIRRYALRSPSRQVTGSGFFATVIVPIEVSPLLRDQTVEHREVPIYRRQV